MNEHNWNQPNQPNPPEQMEGGNRELDELMNSVKQDSATVEQMHAASEASSEAELPPSPPGTTPPEKDAAEEYDLFNVVVESIMKVIQDPTVARAFESLKTKFNQLGKPEATPNTGDITKELIELISMTVSYSVVMSINYYDFHLKLSLERDFATCNELFTKIESDVLATMMKLGDVEKAVTLMQATDKPKE